MIWNRVTRRSFLLQNINNLINSVWLYCLVLEPRFSRRATVSIVAGGFLIQEVFILASLAHGVTFPFFVLHYCAGMGINVGLCILMSTARPVKVLFLNMIFQNIWAFIFALQVLMKGHVLAWNLLRILLNLVILPPFVGLLKVHYLKISREADGGYGLVTGISVVVLVILSTVVFAIVRVKDYNAMNVAALLFILMLVLVVDVLLFRVIAQLNQRRQLAHMELQARILMAHVEGYERMEREAQRYRHDERHHIAALMELAKAGDCEGILNYLRQYQTRVDHEDSPSVRVCENRMVNGVIAAYTRKASKLGISLKADVAIGPRTGIADMDFVIILGNILENAIRACADCGGGIVELHIAHRGRKLVISCTNPCREVVFKHGVPIPPKGAADRVRIGVQSVLCAADRYGGDVDFSASDGNFQCNILLNDTPS